MFEIFLAVVCFGLGLWLGWSAGVTNGTERFRSRVGQWLHETAMEQGELFARHGLRGGTAEDGRLGISATGALVVNMEDLLEQLARSDACARTCEGEAHAEFLDEADISSEPRQEVRLVPSTPLAALIGPDAITSTEACKRIFEYAEAKGLRHGSRDIRCDAAMQTAFGVESCDLFQLTKLVRDQLSNSGA